MTIPIITMVKFGLGMVFVMAVIYLIAVLTPKMAKYTDKFIEKHRTEKANDRTDEVRGIYDLPRQDENKEKED